MKAIYTLALIIRAVSEVKGIGIFRGVDILLCLTGEDMFGLIFIIIKMDGV